ncbi:hypothetical protein E3N88_45347 [Mikania micrantha]|uniref:Exostosin GT47 domain-containing protein n=1 Tax=Mikania micrantha TaxID=192012 RepID=A0A5N6L9N3_9ASTR|nr:hypothetical protein E3N88_45347 [Mikania micrantha]
MFHVREEIAPAVLLVVDFGGWYKVDSKASSNGNSTSDMIQHTQVSLLKDIIVPYTHLLPKLHLSDNQKRQNSSLFQRSQASSSGRFGPGKLWDLLLNEPGVTMEEGFPNATGKEQSINGMRNSEFCLHPAGDTPTSCRLFDAIQSLCIPVIISDNIELPFEGIIDYTEFSIFVAVSEALQPNWLVNHLKSYTDVQKSKLRQNMARVQSFFEYDNGYPGGIGPVPVDGAVNHIWLKVHQKLPMIKEAIVREKRKPPNVLVPRRCHCTQEKKSSVKAGQLSRETTSYRATCVHEINAIVKQVGYSRKEIMFYNYKIPDQDLNFCLVALDNNVDVSRFLQHLDVNKLIEIYIEHHKQKLKLTFPTYKE